MFRQVGEIIGSYFTDDVRGDFDVVLTDDAVINCPVEKLKNCGKYTTCDKMVQITDSCVTFC